MATAGNLWTDCVFESFDGTELFYREKRPIVSSRNSVLVLHRGHEHSGRVVSLVEELDLQDVWSFAFDLRGHGRSPGARGWAPSFETWVKDLNAFANHICFKHGLKTEDMFVIANSVGSVMAAAWVHDYGPNIRGMALAAPAFSINLYVPFALPALRLLSKFTDKAFVTSYVRSGLLTRDPIEARRYDEDRLITKRIAVNVLVSLFDLSRRITADAKAIETPTLILSAGSDFIVRNSAQKKFFDALSSVRKEFVDFPGFRHALFHEKDRHVVIERVRTFAKQCLEPRETRLVVVTPIARPHSVQEYAKLLESPSVFKRIYFTIFRKGLETVGSLSRGVALGLKNGFDSGSSLDYIYQNRPRGSFFLGRLIDRIYLNAVGWRGVRERKQHLKENLKKVMIELDQRGEKPIVMDLAAGIGRYLFEAAVEVDFAVSLHLRDIMPANLEAAKRLAGEFRQRDVSFAVQNAFDANAVRHSDVRPNIVVVSGLFELVEDNNLVFGSLRAAASLLGEGGYLVYTGQPWHPQIEMIARVLNNHRGTRWIMRRRVQAEMDELVRGAGLEKLETVIDGQGIFTVSVGWKRPSERLKSTDRSHLRSESGHQPRQ